VALLTRMDGKPGRQRPVAVLDLARLLSHLGIELVAQDGVQPGPQIGAGLEARMIGPRLDQRLLHQIIGAGRIPAQRDGKGSKRRDGGYQLVAERVRDFHLP
jgi:hypothetical protein